MNYHRHEDGQPCRCEIPDKAIWKPDPRARTAAQAPEFIRRPGMWMRGINGVGSYWLALYTDGVQPWLQADLDAGRRLTL